MKTTAYLRISTVDQDIEKNKSDILKLANEKRLGYVEFIEEQISGKVSWRNRKIFAIINEAKCIRRNNSDSQPIYIRTLCRS